jgi:hypothetical protein
MTCAEFEILLCDYLDGTLDGVRRREVEEHRNGCAACAEFARDVAGAVSFMERVAEVEPPPELLTKLTFEIPSGGVRKGLRAWLTGWLQPVLQPRVAMGMAMTILSFSMLGRLAGIEVRQLQPSDLYPSNVWAAVDNRVHLTWERAVKYYENLRLVYEVQTRLQDWTRQEDEDRKGRGTVDETPAGPGAKTEGKDTK